MVVVDLRRQLEGRNSEVKITQSTEMYVRFYNNEWFVSDSQDGIDLISGCSLGNGNNNKICIRGLVLLYHPRTGFLTLAKEDFNVSKESFPSLTKDLIGSLIAHVEWPSEHIFRLKTWLAICRATWNGPTSYGLTQATKKENVFTLLHHQRNCVRHICCCSER